MDEINEEDRVFLRHLGGCIGNKGLLTYKQFIHEVLFAPKMGYYMRDRERVGREEGTDFYTAESLGRVFRELVLAAIKEILGQEGRKQFTFLEIGTERGGGLLKGLDSHFGGYKTIGAGQAIEIPKKAIVFANELLDAQAFHRLIFKNGKWRELGVRVNRAKGFSEELMPELSHEVEEVIKELPQEAPEGYHVDLPLGAENLLRKIVEQDWRGLIILFDYGFLWDDLMNNYPQGTARAYYRHKQHNDLLANIGKQDITCHICWDRLRDILEAHGFQRPSLERQESFFVNHARLAIEKIVTENLGEFSSGRQTLYELIHPSHMGHKFQVLWAKR